MSQERTIFGSGTSLIKDGIHMECGHAVEAHGEDGCIFDECGCELRRIPEGFVTREEHQARAERQAAETKARAEAEAAAHHAYVSKLRRRARVIVRTRRSHAETDVTEDVVTLLDSLYGALDWGSGFMTEEEESAWHRLAKVLGFDPHALQKVLAEGSVR